jgi:hypothetical protein
MKMHWADGSGFRPRPLFFHLEKEAARASIYGGFLGFS